MAIDKHDDPEIQGYLDRYFAAAHAMQSAVAYFMESGLARSKETTPKHLRVGVNSAMMETSALGRLLMAKGIITEHEYYKSLADGMEAEVASYEQMLPDEFKGKISFA